MPKPTLKDRDGPVSPAHFVPLAEIMQSYDGAVHNYMRQNLSLIHISEPTRPY